MANSAAVLRELVKRTSAKQEKPTTDFLNDLFPQQVAFIQDPSKTKAALCSRRAGKSFTACAYLLKTALERPVDCAYIGLTRGSAKRILWRELKRFKQKYNLAIEFNESELTANLPNGASIILRGAHTSEDIEKFRGEKYALVFIDECASFGAHFTSLVEEVIEPTLIDIQGTLCLIGTPGAACAGLFYDATTNEELEWSVHRWTILQNPHIPHAEEYLSKKRRKKGWAEDHPIYVREWLGQWVRSDDSLVYKFNASRNTFTEEKKDLTYVLGVDLGYNDAFTISVLGFHKDKPEVYVVDTLARSHLIPAQWAELIQSYINQYEPVSIVADAGALGKAIVEEFKQRYQIAVKPAEKQHKAAFIELLNGDLITGRLKVKAGSPLIDQWALLQWDPDKPGKEDGRFKNDLCDATLYAWRECKHWLNTDVEEFDPIPGTEAYWEAEEAKMEQQLIERLEREETQEWWERL